MSFAQIRGQDKAVTFLKELARSKNVFNSLLFLGPEGVGKYLAAINFVKALHCLEPRDGDACDQCAHCVRIERGFSSDIHIVRPQGKSNTIGISQAWEMIREVYLTPSELKYKVFIVDHAHTLTQEAANALLKVLEEPPLNTLFILIATDRQRMVQTILSRCQIARFGLIGTDDIASLLKEKYNVNEEKAEFFAHLALGRPGLAAEFLKLGIDKNEIFDLVNKEFRAARYAFDLENIDRKTLLKNLEIIASWYRDMLLIKLDCGRELIVNQEFYDELRREALKKKETALIEGLEEIFETYHYIHSNVNQKLAMSVLAGTLGG